MQNHCFSSGLCRGREKKHTYPLQYKPPVCVGRKKKKKSFFTCQYPLSVFGRQSLPSLRVADRVKGLKQEGPEPPAQRTNLLPERLAVIQRREGGEEWKGCTKAQANQQLLEEPFAMATNTPPSSMLSLSLSLPPPPPSLLQNPLERNL